MPDILDCPCCEKVFSIEKLSGSRFSCEQCHEEIEPLIFSALFSTPINRSEIPELSQRSTCFFHPQKPAQSICGACGIFVCALCETTTGNKVYCVKCLEKGISKEKEESFIQKAFLYDGLALSFALLPFTLFFLILTPLTALAALLLLFFRKKSKSIIPRTPWRWIFATTLSLLQLSFILWLFLQK